jgi:tRNA(fMet)-specific endonuclease VapC
MTYILDSNILLFLVRENTFIQNEIQQRQIFTPQNQVNISIVTAGGLYSLAMQNNWGQNKYLKLENLILRFRPLPIDSQDLVEVYAEIDTYSKTKHPTLKLPIGQTAVKMGKNDLWIAALTHILDATLLTTDADFDHLNNVFFKVERIIL